MALRLGDTAPSIDLTEPRDPQVRRNAVVMGYPGDSDAPAELSRRVSKDQDHDVWRSAVGTIQFGDVDAVSPCLSFTRLALGGARRSRQRIRQIANL